MGELCGVYCESPCYNKTVLWLHVVYATITKCIGSNCVDIAPSDTRHVCVAGSPSIQSRIGRNSWFHEGGFPHTQVFSVTKLTLEDSKRQSCHRNNFCFNVQKMMLSTLVYFFGHTKTRPLLTPFNLFAPGGFEWNFRISNFQLILVIDGSSLFSHEIALRSLSPDLAAEQSTSVQVMIWCCQAANHHLNQCSLHWRHNGHDSVSNHHPHDCLLNRLFRRRSKKISQLRVTGLCVGNSPDTGEFHAQMASNAEYVSIRWRHHLTNATTS